MPSLGGSLPLEAIPDAREKHAGKGYRNQGWGQERVDREKGVKIAKNGGKGYPNHYDQSSSRGIIRGKGRQSKTTCTLILTSNQRHKTSELKHQICDKVFGKHAKLHINSKRT